MGAFRRFPILAILVALPLASTIHSAHVDGSDRPGVSANGHGPWSHCPPPQDAPCLACSAATLFEGPRAVPRLFAPLVSGVLREIRCSAARGEPAAKATGRSPPSS